MKFRITESLKGQLSELVALEVFNKLMENAVTIGPSKAKELINNAGTKMFTVKFIKKDGTERVMNCMRGVQKHLKGGELRYDPKAFSMVSVYDLQNKGYRMLNLNAITAINMNGQAYEVDSTRTDETN